MLGVLPARPIAAREQEVDVVLHILNHRFRHLLNSGDGRFPHSHGILQSRHRYEFPLSPASLDYTAPPRHPQWKQIGAEGRRKYYLTWNCTVCAVGSFPALKVRFQLPVTSRER